MTSVAFDTGLAVENLQQNGFDLTQSRGVVEVIRTAQADLVTKDDLEQAIELLRRDLTIRMLLIVGSVVGAAAVAIIGAVFAMLQALGVSG